VGINLGFSYPSQVELAMPLRLDQLSLRREEIYHAFTAFQDFVSSPSSSHGLYQIDNKEDIRNSDVGNLETWRDAVQVKNNVHFVGHSFGGSTLVGILKEV
jgi:pimeloyl-ACP methyl ester carboxylesterase